MPGLNAEGLAGVNIAAIPDWSVPFARAQLMVAVLGLLLAGWAVWMSKATPFLETSHPSGLKPVLASEFASTSAELDSIVGPSPDAHNRQMLRLSLRLDYFLIVLYTSFFAAAAYALLLLGHVWWAVALIALGLTAGGFDVAENVSLQGALSAQDRMRSESDISSPNEADRELAWLGVYARSKWAAYFAAAGVLALGLFVFPQVASGAFGVRLSAVAFPLLVGALLGIVAVAGSIRDETWVHWIPASLGLVAIGLLAVTLWFLLLPRSYRNLVSVPAPSVTTVSSPQR